VHITERHTTKMLSRGQIEAQLNRLAVTNVCVNPAFRGTPGPIQRHQNLVYCVKW
jgi:hypothetical protein